MLRGSYQDLTEVRLYCIRDGPQGAVVTVYAVPVASHVTEVGPMYRRAYVCAGGGASQGPSARRTPLDAAESTFMLIHIPTSISYYK